MWCKDAGKETSMNLKLKSRSARRDVQNQMSKLRGKKKNFHYAFLHGIWSKQVPRPSHRPPCEDSSDVLCPLPAPPHASLLTPAHPASSHWPSSPPLCPLPTLLLPRLHTAPPLPLLGHCSPVIFSARSALTSHTVPSLPFLIYFFSEHLTSS